MSQSLNGTKGFEMKYRVLVFLMFAALGQVVEASDAPTADALPKTDSTTVNTSGVSQTGTGAPATAVTPAPLPPAVSSESKVQYVPTPIQMVITQPVTPKIEKLRAVVKENPKNFKSRIELADELAKGFPKPKPGEKQLIERYDIQRATEVITLLKPYNDRLPRKGLIILARGYAQNRDPINELRTLELCLAKNPNDYVVQTMLGDSYGHARRSEEAVASYLEAKKTNAKYRPAYDGMLAVLERTGDRYEARTLLNDMIKVFGAQPGFYTDLCRLYALDNFLEKSVEVCRKAIEKDPKTAENYVYLGTSLRDQEESSHAEKVLNDASKRFPASEPVQSTAGEFSVSRKDYVGAYRHYKQAVVADSKSSKALLGLATSAFELQKYEEALRTFIQACKVNKHAAGEFRLAAGKLRARKDYSWQSKYENAMVNCY
jgi:tetratricopeptide (TPR) repeat protein